MLLTNSNSIVSKTYIRTVYQIVFSTKHRVPCLTKPNREKLFRYLSKILENKRCTVYQIGGIEDHLHIICSLHPSVALASVVKDLKLASSSVIKKEKLFPGFTAWQVGYSAFTYKPEALTDLIHYVAIQEEHHHGETSPEELRRLLRAHGIEFDETYFE